MDSLLAASVSLVPFPCRAMEWERLRPAARRLQMKLIKVGRKDCVSCWLFMKSLGVKTVDHGSGMSLMDLPTH